MKSNNLLWRIEQLEKSYGQLDIKIEEILQNHLPHINEALASLRTEVRIYALLNIGLIILAKLIKVI